MTAAWSASRQKAVTEYYKLFYNCGLTQELYQELLLDAMP